MRVNSFFLHDYVMKSFLTFLFVIFFFDAVAIQLTSEVKNDSRGQYQARITVVHSKSEDLSKAVFFVGEEKKDLKKVSDEQIKGQTASIFVLDLPQQKEGLYIFPIVTMIYEGKKYQSIPISYQVVYSPLTTPLRIEGGIDQNQPLYPGQRFQAIMKIYYVGKVQMTREDLPLLNIKGFEKQGSIIFHEGQEGEYSYQEIIQVYEVKKPGKFKIDSSKIAGNVQLQDSLVKGEASLDPMTIEVAPFPEEGKPPSFDGMLGPAIVDVSLISPSTMNEGDLLKLAIHISGDVQLSTVVLPQLLCQPGFGGFFRLSDSPPTVEVKNDAKTFVVELRPLSASIENIPPIELSYFDLNLKKYVTTISKEIPITIKAVDLPPLSSRLAVIDTDWKKVFENPPYPPIKPPIPLGPPFLESFKLYQQGEAAENVVDRERKFNAALDLSEKDLQKVNNIELAALLHYNIGNIFFQLEHPAMAAYHYYASMATGKAPEEVKTNLNLALKILGVTEGQLNIHSDNSFFRWTLIASILGLVMMTIFRRWNKLFFRIGSVILTLGIVGGVVLSMLFYFIPLQGVFIEAATLRTGPAEKYPYLDRQPILAGTLVKVYDITSDGEWLKISYEDKGMGFVEERKIRLVE